MVRHNLLEIGRIDILNRNLLREPGKLRQRASSSIDRRREIRTVEIIKIVVSR